MSFTKKNISSRTKTMGFIKWATLFFLWMSCIFFVTRAFNITAIAPNAIQYIQQIFLTASGDNVSATGVILDGRASGGITIKNLTSAVILATDSNGKIIASSSGGVYNLISWYVVAWATGDIWATWIQGIQWNTWTQWNTGATGSTWFLNGGTTWATPFRNWSSWVTGNTNIYNTGWNVGIGTATPGYKLQVVGDGYFSSNLSVNGNVAIQTPISSYALDVKGSANVSSDMIVGLNGIWSLGIATDTPGYRLDVIGNWRFTTNLRVAGGIWIWTYVITTWYTLEVSGSIHSNGFISKWNGVSAGGVHATAMGSGTQALGTGATAMWVNTTALWDYSTAMGKGTSANGISSTVMGISSSADWLFSTAMGNDSHAGWTSSIAMGGGAHATLSQTIAIWSNSYSNWIDSLTLGVANYAIWLWSAAIGHTNIATGQYSLAIGFGSRSSGAYSTAIGSNVYAMGNYSTAMGKNNIGLTGSIFEIWIGISTGARENIFTILGNWKVGIGTWSSAPTARLTVDGGIRAIVIPAGDPCVDTWSYPSWTMFYSSGNNNYCFCDNLNTPKTMTGADCN